MNTQLSPRVIAHPDESSGAIEVERSTARERRPLRLVPSVNGVRPRAVHPFRIQTHDRLIAVVTLVVSLAVLALLKWMLATEATKDPYVAVYGVLVTGFVATRFIAGHRYRPKPMAQADLPTLAVIVPVKNEGMLIGATISMLFKTDYPKDRFEVVVVDDGSDDETATVLRIAQRAHERLRVITLPRNMGKRKAMAAGVAATASELVVVIDSDTLVATDAFGLIAAHFADEQVAAVSGRTIILNEDESWLTRVQALIYEVSFRIHKSAEATLGSVTCCPGCFSAYRRASIAGVLDEWKSQTFGGEETIFGDDRALTMLMLRDGWNVHYEPSATAETQVPEAFRGYLRQQLRWKKSWLQQGYRGCAFMWRRPLLSALWFYLGLVLSLMGPHVILRAFVIGPLFHHSMPWRFVVGAFAMSFAMAAYLSIVRRDAKRLVAGAIYPMVAVVLAMQMVGAIARLADARWGTR